MSRTSSNDPGRQRARAERMLRRAQLRQKQATKLVEKWKERIAELDRATIAAQQPTLWAEIQDSGSIETDTLRPMNAALSSPSLVATFAAEIEA